jgi:hypothetical protein
MIAQDVIIVFVGARRCAYRMDLFTGSDCSMTMMMPYLDFDEADARVCVHDAPYINTGPYGTGPERCRVMTITPLTDDQLLELYAEVGARPPLPPIGSGELSVGEEDEAAGQGEGEGQPAPAGQESESAPAAGTEPPDGPAPEATSDAEAREEEALNLSAVR